MTEREREREVRKKRMNILDRERNGGKGSRQGGLCTEVRLGDDMRISSFKL